MNASITSTAEGWCRRIAGVAASASSRSANWITSTAFAAGSGTRLILASTTTPSVPSEPTMSFARLNGLSRCRSDELVQVVAADPAQHFRVRDGRSRSRTRGPAVALPGSRRLRASSRAQNRSSSAPRHRPEARDGVPSERSTSSAEHVIDRLAVDHRSRAGGVVGDHAADRGAARRRDVRREPQAMRGQRGIELVKDDAGLDARPALRGVHFEQAVEVLRGVDDEAGADGLAGL